MPEYYIGLMTGTSFDGVDVALVDESCQQLKANYFLAMPAELKANIIQLTQPGYDEIELLMAVNYRLAELYSMAVNLMLDKYSFDKNLIKAIGCHGQTIRHRPDAKIPYTLQLGCPHHLAHKTGISVVSQFRQADICAGGQGAPLAPLYHKHLFYQQGYPVTVVNIGGIANVTHINADGIISGFDTGPGNCLLDDWAMAHLNKAYDEGGQWAMSGQVDKSLVDKLMSDPFIEQAAPKSVDKARYSLDFLQEKLTGGELAQDIQASLVQFTVSSIVKAIVDQKWSCEEVMVSGGGAHNQAIMQTLKRELPNTKVLTATDKGIDGDYIEAMMIAWLASLFMQRQSSDTRTITGANRPVVLGSLVYS